MAGTTMDEVVAAFPGRQRLDFLKNSATAKGAGLWHSYWAVGGIPAAGGTPPTGAGESPIDTEVGAPVFTNPAAGLDLQVMRSLFFAVATGIGVLELADRLWHGSGLSGTSTASQTVNSTALTRYTTGEGCEIWGEVYTAFGATNTVITVTYTNSAGVGGRSATYTFNHGAPVAGQTFRFKLQDGDTGVRSIQSAQLSVSTGTAGDWGLLITRPLLSVPLKADQGEILDFAETELQIIEDDACLYLRAQVLGTTAPQITAQISASAL